MQKLQDLVAELMQKNRLSYDEAWLELRRTRPELFPTPPPVKGGSKFEVRTRATKGGTENYLSAVNELQRREGLCWDTAWSEARRRNPAFYEACFACNELPPAVLGALGLPMAATREQYLIFKTAERVKTITPEMAAKVLVVLTQFQQLTQGLTFDATWTALEKHFPEIFAALDEVGSANERLDGAAYATQLQGVNTSDGLMYACSPTFPTLTHV